MKEMTLSTAAGNLPSDSNSLPSLGLAAIVHLALLAFLWIGVQWQSKEPVTVEAEVWDMSTRQAAPEAKIEEPPPVVEQQPEARVLPTEAATEDAEIVLAQEKKRKLEDVKKQQELQREERRKEKLAEKKKAEELAKLEKEKEKAKEQKKQDAKKLSKKDQALADKLFAENMRRLTGQVSAVAGSGGNGDAAKSTGNNRGDPSYIALISARVKSKMNSAVSDNSNSNPTVEYHIELLPDGSLRGIKKIKSSGIPRFDEDVENAIRLAAPFPKDKSGTVPSSMDIVNRLKD